MAAAKCWSCGNPVGSQRITSQTGKFGSILCRLQSVNLPPPLARSSCLWIQARRYPTTWKSSPSKLRSKYRHTALIMRMRALNRLPAALLARQESRSAEELNRLRLPKFLAPNSSSYLKYWLAAPQLYLLLNDRMPKFFPLLLAVSKFHCS